MLSTIVRPCRKVVRLYSTIPVESISSNTSERLTALRATMTNMDVFVVPSEDAHQSEYTAECDNRRKWISGFTGSAGTAIVTKAGAALFTDGRYFSQANKELDKQHWQLMKQGLPGVPTWQEYLIKELPPKSTIGIDPSVINMQEATKLEAQLKSIGSKLIYVDQNPIDKIRLSTADSHNNSRPCNPINIHPIEYAGKSVKSKLRHLRQSCQYKNIIISALDEIAWLFNLRGSDIHCSPVFFSYCLVTKDSVTLYVQKSAMPKQVFDYLAESGVQIKKYDQIVPDLQTMHSEEPFLVDPCTTNMSLLQALKENHNNPLIHETDTPSPLSLAKAIKNESELNGIKNCHKLDAIALCKHFAWLDHSLSTLNNPVREAEAAEHLESMRRLEKTFVGPSFDTIAATGPNGAIVHYQPTTDINTSIMIDPNRIYLCDSGAQYVNGTTDVTRTYLFSGEPTDFQKRAFTRVLQAHISVDRAVFPQGTTGYQLDSIARLPLWKDGLNFRHGVGHGVGAYLNVHEGPHGIGNRLSYNKVPLQPGMLVTNEPGYYEEGQFGIRIENVLAVRRVNTAYRFENTDSFGFEHVTFVPLGKRLLDTGLLSVKDKEWINAYHQECRDVLGPLLSRKNSSKTLSWIERETEPL